MLGEILGHTIQRHGGKQVFETVERLRLNCRRLRECTEKLAGASGEEEAKYRQEITALDQEITQLVESCDLETAIDVLRLCGLFSSNQHSRATPPHSSPPSVRASECTRSPTWLVGRSERDISKTECRDHSATASATFD